ncbi:MAG: N-acetylmuramoyl-L-alanine amidase LytC precursor [bacterium ADurb.Bin429]|nr:MAG: N-acetylmuramoyl-L-alanine amidase LytC precursor [bacterium ADurb.Bin429]
MSSRLLICWLIGLCCIVGATADTLVVAGRAQTLVAPLITEGNDILAPVAPSLRLLGARATTNGNTITIQAPTAAGGRREVRLTAGAREATNDGRRFTLPVAPREVDGNLYLPTRALAPILNAEARYDAETRTLTLSPLVTVAYEAREDGVAVLVRCAAPLQYTSGQLQDPDRCYLDFKHTGLGMAEQQMAVETDPVQRLRLSHGGGPDGAVRLVVDLTGPATMNTAVSDGGRLATVTLAPKAPEPDPAAPTLPAPGLPGAPAAPVKLLGLSLVPQGVQQVELTVETDGAPLVECAYDSGTRLLTLTFPNSLNTLPAEALAVKANAIVAKMEATGSAETPGAKLLIALKADSGYLIDRDATRVRLLIGSFSIADMTIVLDAGHGGHDSGAISPNGTREKDINLDVILRTEKLLKAAGAKVILTRRDDTFIQLQQRPVPGNSNRADLFISVHCNSTPKRNSTTGTETYYKTPRSAQFAAMMHAEMVKALRLKNNGVRVANFLVIRESTMPSVLLELGYLNHSRDEALLLTPEFRQRAAQGIVEGIRRYAATKSWKLRRGERFDDDVAVASAN